MDRLTEMEAFATVVDQGGFTDAAKKMGISKSAVSKHVSSLEARLGARLLNRFVQKIMRAIGAIAFDDVFNRFLPFLGFDRIDILSVVCHMSSPFSAYVRI